MNVKTKKEYVCLLQCFGVRWIKPQIEYETLRKLCEFYGVMVGDLLVYEDRRARRRPWSEGISPRRAGSEAAVIVPAIPTLRPA